jgi:hypothetical protein
MNKTAEVALALFALLCGLSLVVISTVEGGVLQAIIGGLITGAALANLVRAGRR